jgi:hypothetical protein
MTKPKAVPQTAVQISQYGHTSTIYLVIFRVDINPEASMGSSGSTSKRKSSKSDDTVVASGHATFWMIVLH